MTNDDPVRRALAELARFDASRRAPAHLEDGILEAFDRQRRRRSLQRDAATVWAYGRGIAAAAVAVVVAVTIYVKTADRAVVRPAAPAPPVASAVNRPGRMSERLGTPEVPSTPPTIPAQSRRRRNREQSTVQADISRTRPADMMNGDVVHSIHVQVPRALLPLLGVPIIDPDAEGMVNLEVLVAEDGLGRTIRVVR